MPLHQMLALSPSSPSPLRSLRSSIRPPSNHSACCLAEEEATMGALKEEEFPVDDLLAAEEFLVDDLLNLEFVQNEGEEEVETLLENKEMEVSSSPSSTSSTVSFEPSLALPAHDAKEFEWVSLIMDESLSEFPSSAGVASSPTSAAQSLDGGGTLAGNTANRGPPFVSPTVCVLSTEAVVPTKAKRSKRSRNGSAAPAAAWSMSSPLLFPQSTSDSTATSSCSSSSFSVPSLPHDHHHQPQILLLRDSPPPAKKQKPKKRGRKPKSPLYAASAALGERRCAHCGTQKTPQWRAGPLGAKTLCNACGVRFKSGRLLPEYRPACSPTFVSQIHSNCHRRVLEMRRNKEAAPPVTSFKGLSPVLSFPSFH